MLDPRTTSRFHFRPLIFIGIGGIAAQTLLLLRAYIWLWLGFIPPWVRFLVIDFKTDDPMSHIASLSDDIPFSVWSEVEFQPLEEGLLDSDVDGPELAERILNGDEDVSYLRDLVPPEVVESYSGTEASQIPAMMRMFLSLAVSAADPREQSWFEKLKAHILAVKPRSKEVHKMIQMVSSSAMTREPALAVILFGSEGGTGYGGGMPVTAALKKLATKHGAWLYTHAHIISGHYRPEDGQEDRKATLSHALDIDFDRVKSSNATPVNFPLGPTRLLTVKRKLFDLVYRHEANDRLEHDDGAVVASVARTLLFLYFSKAGFAIEKSRANVHERPRILSLSNL